MNSIKEWLLSTLEDENPEPLSASHHYNGNTVAFDLTVYAVLAAMFITYPLWGFTGDSAVVDSKWCLSA